MATTHGEKCELWVENALKTDYIFEKISPTLVRNLARLDDRALRLGIFVMICDLASGMKQMPTKIHKIRLAAELVRDGAKFKRVRELTGVSKSTYYKMKRIING